MLSRFMICLSGPVDTNTCSLVIANDDEITDKISLILFTPEGE